MGLEIACGNKRLEKHFLAGSNNCSSLFKYFFFFASLISPALLPAPIYLSWKWMQSWWKSLDSWLWKLNPFGRKAVWNLPFTQQGNTGSQHHCCLQRRSGWCMSISQPSSMAMVARQAPHAVPSMPPSTCLVLERTWFHLPMWTAGRDAEIHWLER